MEQRLLAVGNYGNSIKIYGCSDEKLELLSEEGGINNPSYLAVDKTKQYLFAVCEADEVKDGFIFSYAINRERKKLTLLDKLPTFGSGSCHIAVSDNNRQVLVSNYGSGSVSIFALEEDGKLSFKELIENHGDIKSKNSRQQSPHAHGVFFYRNGFFSVDLGLDCALFYEFDQQGKAIYRPQHSLFLKTGNGPRHMAILDDYAYVLGELTNEITVFKLEANTPSKIVSVVSTLPKDFEGESFASAITFSEDNKTLYCSNRGHDSIAFFNVYKEQIELSGTVKTMGSYPRDFIILKDKYFFVSANQFSDSLTLIKNNETSDNRCVCQSKTTAPTCLIML